MQGIECTPEKWSLSRGFQERSISFVYSAVFHQNFLFSRWRHRNTAQISWFPSFILLGGFLGPKADHVFFSTVPSAWNLAVWHPKIPLCQDNPWSISGRRRLRRTGSLFPFVSREPWWLLSRATEAPSESDPPAEWFTDVSLGLPCPLCGFRIV